MTREDIIKQVNAILAEEFEVDSNLLHRMQMLRIRSR